MHINELGPSLVRLFSELVDGAPARGDAFMLNSGDLGLLRGLDRLSAAEASQSTDGGATWTAPIYSGISGRDCLGPAECVPDPSGPISTAMIPSDSTFVNG